MKYFWPLVSTLFSVAPVLVWAQEVTTPLAKSATHIAMPANVRIGAWLTQNRPDLSGVMFAPGLMWNSKTEARQQEVEKKAILLELTERSQTYPARAAYLGELKRMLESMPVTGRKLLPLQDPWLMQSNSSLEPITGSEDELVVTGKPDRVRVITPQLRWCDVKVFPDRWALDYLKACGADLNADTVWLIQPNGQISNLRVADWNAQKQDAPAPGAWLWVTATNNSPKLSKRIAKFIATQGVAQGPSLTSVPTSTFDAGKGSDSSPTSAQDPSKVAPVDLPMPPMAAPRSEPVVLNDWGLTGLLQTPSARTPQAGLVSFTANRVWPYTHTTFSLSPFDNVELGFRYTNITNRLYGPLIAGDQGYKDKSAEIKWRVMDETAAIPALAVGLRDPGGTGLFAGEYVVASKRWGDLDMSLGLGWGYLGARGNIANPLKIFGQRFAVRHNSDTGSGGTAQLSPLFTGPTALFGGVQWHTPIPEMVLKVEWDGNDYKHEPLGNDIGGARSPLNLGVAWQNGPLSLSLGYERGQQWMLGLSLSTDLSQLSRAKPNEPAAWPVKQPLVPAGAGAITKAATDQPALNSANTQPIASGVKKAIAEQTGWKVRSARQESDTWTIEFENAQGFSLSERIDRGMRVVHELAPHNIQNVQFVLTQQDVAISRRVVDRAAWADSRTAWRGAPAVLDSVQEPAALDARAEATTRKPSSYVDLNYQQNVGGPDGYLYALNAIAQAQWPLWTGAWAQGRVNARLLDNYSNYHYTAPSNLPRVRTLIREYQTGERITLPYAQINQMNQWGDGIYSLAYAGALESMYAGIGAEVLWRPMGQRWALGADVNRLAQRGFDQRFSLRDYRVNSGHITAYWDTGWMGTEAKLLVGQYLAGDRGATLEVARRFDNGARMGAWVTKTNVSSASFGEGSFDKGVFVSIPFDAFLTAWSTQTASLVWQPLIRDGGARLNKSQNLWNITRSRDEREWTTPPVPMQ